MAKLLTPDICVIGAGSGGLTVAAAAAAFGVSVVLVEKGKMGGDCLNYGCVPSKALIASARLAHAMRNSAAFGITNGAPEIDFAAVHDHVHSVIAAIAPNDSAERFGALGVNVIQAEARFINARSIVAADQEIRPRRFVIATGSTPLVPDIPGLEEVNYLTNETIFERKKRPNHLVVIGGGPIGMELAQAHRRLGSNVTVLEAQKALGKDDPEVAAIALERIRAEGVKVLEGAKVTGVERRSNSGVRVAYEMEGGGGTVDGSHLLVAVGRKANVEGLDLGKAGVKHGPGGIRVNRRLRTNRRRIYAIGDVAGGPQFTHVAGYHAGLVIRSILFRLRARVDRRIIPWATFTDPEIAHVGMKEDEARAKYKSIHVLRWPYAENDRAQAERKTVGMVKLVTGRRGTILGASIVGANASELISMWALAISREMTVSDIAGYLPPYPTMSEIGKRAAMTYFTPMARRSGVRRLIGFLRKFG